MSNFQKFDSWFIEKVCEPILWRIEARTEWNNFRFAQILLAVYTAAGISFWIGSDWFAYLMMLWTLTWGVSLFEDLRQAERHTKSGSRNPLRVRNLYIFFRYLTLFGAVTNSMKLLLSEEVDGMSVIILVSAFLFFSLAVCTPMPPGWKKPVKVRSERLAGNHP